MAPSASGIAGSFPALDTRLQSVLREWLQHMQELAKHDADRPEAPSAPFAANSSCTRAIPAWRRTPQPSWSSRVPITINSLGGRADVNEPLVTPAGATGARRRGTPRSPSTVRTATALHPHVVRRLDSGRLGCSTGRVGNRLRSSPEPANPHL